MEYRQLGASGLRVSVIGLGGNTFGRYADQQQTTAIVRQAIESGINIIDTADTYGHGVSEELLGNAIQGHRDDLVIATKVGMRMGDGPNEYGSSRRRIIAGCEASLRRLRIETIDLYQIHEFDPDTPLEETLGALDDLVRAGKVRYIGCSNYDGWRIVQALWISDRAHLNRFVSVQPEYNLLKREVEREIVPVCQEFGLGIIPYFPLDAGVLTGKYQPGKPAPEGTRGYDNPRFAPRLRQSTLEAVQRLDAWARESDHTVAELALAWLASRPAVSTIIAGTRRPEQVAANARAADWKLTPDDLAEVERLQSTD
ncbi:MAG TPA: aldo/keto reductase [Ktedonobacterales bacterium]|nr:aldo/keto reductase [Ktedonobacterales bacterium]